MLPQDIARLTDSYRQSVMHVRKMLETMGVEFKVYHYEIVASIVPDDDAAREQVVFDEHQRQSVKFVDRLGDLLAKPQPNVSVPASTNDRLVDKQLGLLGNSVQTIQRAFETPDFVDTCINELHG